MFDTFIYNVQKFMASFVYKVFSTLSSLFLLLEI